MNKILSNQIKFAQYSNNKKNNDLINLDLNIDENDINKEIIHKIEKLNSTIKNDYANLQTLNSMLKSEFEQIKLENDELNKNILSMKNELDNISIINNNINNELNLLKSSLENVKSLNNKLQIENDILKSILMIDYEKLNIDIN